MTSQNHRAAWSQTTDFIDLRPEDELGSGGEGTVYRLKDYPDLVAKIYHSDKLMDDTIRKLEVMIEHPLVTEDERTGHLFVSWPKDILREKEDGPVIGFLMPKVETANANTLIDYYNRSQRRANAPKINYANLCSTAKSLAIALNRIHGISYTFIVGDINESNAVITKDGQITLIDADSFQVTDRRHGRTRTLRCSVGKREYTPPELRGRDFKRVNRNQYHDSFALAVIIYQLLMEGAHPFLGIYTGEGEAPQVADSISKGYFLHSTSRNIPLKPARYSVYWESLPQNIRDLFRRCFDDGHTNPEKRPSPKEWEDTLNEAIKSLKTCSVNSNHVYFDEQASGHGQTSRAGCTWCERKANIGIESFPPYSISQPQPSAQPQTQATTAQSQPQMQPSQAQPVVQPLQASRQPSTNPNQGSRILGLPRRLAAILAGVTLLAVIGICTANSGDDGTSSQGKAAAPPAAPAPALAVAPIILPTDTPTNTPTIASTYTPRPPSTPLAAAVVPTNTPVPTSTSTHTAVPTETHTPRPTFTPSPTSTATHTPSPTATHTPVPTDTATPSPSPTPMATATGTSTPTPIPCEHVGPGANLSGCSLLGANLLGVDLSNADLTHTDLRDAYMKDANLTGANLSYAQVGALSGMNGVNLRNVDLSSTDLTGVASFEKADLSNVRFGEGQDLSGIVFIRANLARAVLRGTVLRGANFKDAVLYHTDLSGADLTDATLTDALTSADLTGAVLEDAVLRGVNTRDESDIIYDQTTEFAGADLRGSKWPRRQDDSLANYNFKNASLRDANFKWSDLAGVIFDGADLRSVNFVGADLVGASFCNANLNDTDFRDANLSQARIDLEEAKTNGAKMDDDTVLFGIRSCAD